MVLGECGKTRRYGGIGRHKRLKISRTLVRMGSSPITATRVVYRTSEVVRDIFE